MTSISFRRSRLTGGATQRRARGAVGGGRGLRGVVAVAVLAALLAAAPTAAAGAHGGLSDVPDGGAHSDAIHTLFDQRVFEGTLCGDSLFCPDEPLTRADLAVWMVRVVDGEDPSGIPGTRFLDIVGTGHPHWMFIERLAELGITKGCTTDGQRFCPDDSVTRAQMASFLVRAFNLSAAEQPAGFTDVVAGAAHTSNIDALAASGVTRGCSTEPLRYCPQDPVTRAQMASFLVRGSEAAVVWTISEPLTRCATDWYGAGRISAYVSNTTDGYYEPIVEGGANSCERIKTWWDQARQAEADRIARGEYPCEYPAAYNLYPRDVVQTNGPAMLVGCWPRIYRPGNLENTFKQSDPADEAARLWNVEGFWILPPNHPELIDALWDCYRDALEGPPPGWTAPSGGEWMTVNFCNVLIQDYGNPVRDMGVTPKCAAEQMAGKIAERKAHGFVAEQLYAHDGTAVLGYGGDYPWANCATVASRLLPNEPLPTYRQRCEAVIDASVNHQTTDIAAVAGYGRGQAGRDHVVKVVKAMFCEGTRAAIRANGAAYEDFVPLWPQLFWQDYFQYRWRPRYGLPYRPVHEFMAGWLPPEGSQCFEAVLLVAAHKATRGESVRVQYC